MNKTIDISLAGILFHLDETAYYTLKKYLESVRKSLLSSEDIEEVMNEIEARIAELFIERQSSPQQVINNKHVDEIIMIMGQPEDYEEEPSEKAKATYTNVKKGLFRDFDKSVIGGVVAGLAHYIGMDVTLLRLVFVALLFITHGSIILIYILLWIVIPKAKTASDKLKMKGEKVDVDSIVDQVSTEDESVKKKIKLGETVENTTRKFGNGIVKLIGFLVMLLGGTVLISLLFSLASFLPVLNNHILSDGLPFQQIIHLSPTGAGIITFILIGFPFGILFLLGVKMLFPNTKPVSKTVFLSLGTIWFLSLLFSISKISEVMLHKNTHNKVLISKNDWTQQKDTLQLNVIDTNKETPDDYIEQQSIYYSFTSSKDNKYHLKTYYQAQGMRKKEAKENAERIRYSFEIDSLSNIIDFDKYFMFPSSDFVSEHKIFIKIYIPEGKLVKLPNYISGHTRNTECDMPQVIQNIKGEMNCSKEYPYNTYDDESIRIKRKNLKVNMNRDGINISAKDDNNNVSKIAINKNGVHLNTQKDDGDSTAVDISNKKTSIKNQ